jgi:GDPmannose 4,6-dehydratase
LTKDNAHSPRRALIFGISGQDGAYLAQLLVRKGYEVHGTSRDSDVSLFSNLVTLGIRDAVQTHSVVLTDFRSVIQVIDRIRPQEIYNLASQSSVALSFNQPVDTFDSMIHANVNILEALRFLKLECRYYNASSSEMFGDTTLAGADETTQFHPRSPYGVGKAAAYWIVANYREAYNLFCCSGILFNHESPLRPARFVTQKIVRGAVAIAQGREKSLTLGNLEIARDWGWAPEYVDAMWRMLQQDEPADYVIATGRMAPLREFVARAFERVGLDWREFVTGNASFSRPSDIAVSVGNPGRAAERLKWVAATDVLGVVDQLVDAELAALAAKK